MNTLPIALPEVTTAGGFLLVLALVLPLLGVLAALVLGGRNARRVAFVAIPIGLALALAIVAELVRSGQTLVYLLFFSENSVISGLRKKWVLTI